MEIELKLAPVTREQAERVFSDPEIASCLGNRKQTNMETTYYDTEDGALRKIGWSLRLRREGTACVCTLKGPTEELSRPEFAVTAESVGEGAALLLKDAALPETARAAMAQPLLPTCSARFVRTETEYDDGEGLRLCLSFDQGELQNGALRAPLCELELELLSGEAARLRVFGEHVAAKHSLPICGESKHRRAMALAEPPVREISPFFAASELLNYCIRSGYVQFWIDEEKQIHYGLTALGASVLPSRFGVDFGKSCATPPEERS